MLASPKTCPWSKGEPADSAKNCDRSIALNFNQGHTYDA